MLLVAPSAAFNVAQTMPCRTCRLRPMLAVMAENPVPRVPVRTAFIGAATVASAFALATVDLPRLAGGNPDYIASAVDAWVTLWGATTLLGQAGVGKKAATTTVSPAGMTCCVTLNVGREPGTWMPREWASSGARLSLPLVVKARSTPLPPTPSPSRPPHSPPSRLPSSLTGPSVHGRRYRSRLSW